MPRRREVPKRIILPDPKYNDVVKVRNSVMKKGKKSTVRALYGAFDTILGGPKRSSQGLQACP